MRNEILTPKEETRSSQIKRKYFVILHVVTSGSKHACAIARGSEVI